jgi:hypothetical protein
VLSGRLYRASLLPFVLVLAVAAFSLSARTHPLRSSLAPDAFDGSRAFSELNALAAAFPDRRPGSAPDNALAQRISSALQGMGSPAAGGFRVRTRRFWASTIDGERMLQTVVAQRPGSTGAAPIAIIAHRDSAAGGGAAAQLSGTAALLELARVFAARETRRSLVIVSTSGGSCGAAGAADFAAMRESLGLHGRLDAAIALGDVAGAQTRGPVLLPFSDDGSGSAAPQLQRTVGDAIRRETGTDPGSPSVIGQLAHLATGLTVGEQGPLNAAGIPALLVQRTGEREPPGRDAVSAARLTAVGRAVLTAIDALDGGPDVPARPQAAITIQRMTLPQWAVRLLVLSLLIAPALTVADGIARERRRRRSKRSLRRLTIWVLMCALPFLLTAAFARVIGALSIVTVPGGPVSAQGLGIGATALGCTTAVALVLALAWLLWPQLLARLTLRTRPRGAAAGLAIVNVLLVLALAIWIANPYSSLLVVPATHLALPLSSAEVRSNTRAMLALVLLALLPALALVGFYSHQLGLDVVQIAWMSVSLLAVGHLGPATVIAWSVALGCAVAGVLMALAPRPHAPTSDAEEVIEVTIRGPLTYAGPGSLGGTESALRR